ncbi:MAG: hypothetical protein ACR2JZ_02390 [Candidatus Limnocylindrales bacterium]
MRSPNLTPPITDGPPKHVVDQYTHRTQTVVCVCGWTGSSASPDGRTSEWSLHVAANRGKKP